MAILRAIAALTLWLLLCPCVVGLLPAWLVCRERVSPLKSWIYGFFTVLGIFQILAVRHIRQLRTLSQLITAQTVTAALFGAASLIAYLWLQRSKTGARKGARHLPSRRKPGREELLLWGIFFILLAIQLLLSMLIMTSDGDDAYYLAQALVSVDTDTMYLYDAYTGVYTSYLDYRHILAPFPMWLALLSRMSGVHVTVLAHTVLPPFLILAAYLIYALLGERLFVKKPERLPLFMILLLLIISFSNYSVYTAETFLLTRTWQGKAFLAGQVLPMAFYLICLIAERTDPETEETERLPLYGIVGMLVLVNLCGTLASTMGVLVLALFECVFFVLIALRSRRWRVLGCLPVAMLPCLYYGIIYLLQKGLVIAMQNAYQ